MTETFSTKQSYETYVDYLAKKRHFTTESYDYHKYHGKVKASFDSFKTRKDVYQFFKLSKNPNYKDLFTANMVVKPNIWIGDLLEDEAEQRYLKWKGSIDSLTYVLTTDLAKLKPNYQNNFIVAKDGQYPHLINLYMQRTITLETFAILTNLSNVFPYWQENIVDKVICSKVLLLSRKYYPFLNIDKKKISATIKQQFQLA